MLVLKRTIGELCSEENITRIIVDHPAALQWLSLPSKAHKENAKSNRGGGKGNNELSSFFAQVTMMAGTCL
jgi:hypothetical protein